MGGGGGRSDAAAVRVALDGRHASAAMINIKDLLLLNDRSPVRDVDAVHAEVRQHGALALRRVFVLARVLTRDYY